MENQTKRSMEYFVHRKYRLVLGGVMVGAASGLVVSLFRLVLQKAGEWRPLLTQWATEGGLALVGAVCLFVLCYLVVYLAYRQVPLSSGSGIPQVKGELLGQVDQPWMQVLVAKFAAGFCAMGAGLSLGREGPSVQIGAMTGKAVARVQRKTPTEEKMMMTCGAAAGLSGAFCAPFAGTVFALEELHKNFSADIMVSTMAASVTSDFVAVNLFGLSPVFTLPVPEKLILPEYWRVILLGILLGVFGVIYNRFTDFVQNLYGRIPWKSLRIAIPFGFAALFVCVLPQVLGGGHELAGEIAEGLFSVKMLLLLFGAKFLFSMISFGSGAPGGIFLPLLVLGALIGGLYGEAMVGLSLDPVYRVNFVTLGMAGCFTAIVRSPVTGVILITEMTGNFTNFLPLTIVALIAYVTAEALGGQPIYDQLLARLLTGKNLHTVTQEGRSVRSKVLIESPVYMGSQMDGKELSQMHLPPGCLVVSVQRAEKEVVPSGTTVLQGGDQIVVFCAESYAAQVDAQLDEICRTILRR